MVKYREILRLNALGVSIRNIAFSVACSPTTVQSTLERACATGITWPLAPELGDAEIKALLYPPSTGNKKQKAAIDCDRIARELKRRNVTMTLLWSEYCNEALSRNEEPYMFSSFCTA